MIQVLEKMKKPSRKTLKLVTRKFASLSGLPMNLARLAFKNKSNWCNINEILKAKEMWPSAAPALDDFTTKDDGTVTININFNYSNPNYSQAVKPILA